MYPVFGEVPSDTTLQIWQPAVHRAGKALTSCCSCRGKTKILIVFPFHLVPPANLNRIDIHTFLSSPTYGKKTQTVILNVKAGDEEGDHVWLWGQNYKNAPICMTPFWSLLSFFEISHTKKSCFLQRNMTFMSNTSFIFITVDMWKPIFRPLITSDREKIIVVPCRSFPNG